MTVLNITKMSDLKVPTLRWYCQVCGKPIEGSSGYVELYSLYDGHIHYPGSDVRCRVLHHRCDEQPDAMTDWMPVNDHCLKRDLDVYLREWVAHVCMKRWCTRETVLRMVSLWFDAVREVPE